MPLPRTSMLRQLTATPLARPCSEPWSQMAGDGRVRHCASCEREVYDLSAMSELEAEARLLNARDALPCIRYVRRVDGSIAHLAAPRGFTAPAPRMTASAASLGITLAAATLHADGKPAQCIAYAQPAQAPLAAASPSSAQAPPANAPAPAPPVAQDPPPLGGAPPAISQHAPFGTVTLRSKGAADVTIVGVTLHTPLATYLLPPGTFDADVRRPDGTTRPVTFTIVAGKTTIVDLDAPPKRKRPH